MVAFLAVGLIDDLGALLGIQHAVMLPAHAHRGALRKEENSHPHGRHAAADADADG